MTPLAPRPSWELSGGHRRKERRFRSAQDMVDAHYVAAGLLESDNLGVFRQPRHGVHRDLDTGPAGILYNTTAGRYRPLPEMAREPSARLVVIGATEGCRRPYSGGKARELKRFAVELAPVRQ